MHRRTLIMSSLATVAGIGMPASAPASEAAWLRVYLDRFELDGNRFMKSSELVVALKLIGKTKKVSLNWVIPKTEAERRRMTERVEEAQRAAEDAGLGRLPAVANEIF
jgi:hypothetical protein